MDPQATGTDSYTVTSLVTKMTGNMRFLGWFYIIYGGLASLTIIGAIFGIPLLISGLRLKEAGDEFDAFSTTGSLDSVLRGFERQNSFFFIQKVFIILGIILAIIYIIVIIALISSGIFASGMNELIDA